jgi:hypothetical protein
MQGRGNIIKMNRPPFSATAGFSWCRMPTLDGMTAVITLSRPVRRNNPLCDKAAA